MQKHRLNSQRQAEKPSRCVIKQQMLASLSNQEAPSPRLQKKVIQVLDLIQQAFGSSDSETDNGVIFAELVIAAIKEHLV